MDHLIAAAMLMGGSDILNMEIKKAHASVPARQ